MAEVPDGNPTPNAEIPIVTDPLGPEPTPAPEPDRVGLLQQQVQQSNSELAAAIQGVNARIAELRQAKPKADESAFDIEPDNKAELKELLATVKEMKGELDRTKRQSEVASDQTLVRNAVVEAGMIVDNFNSAHDFTKNPKHAAIAAKIKDEVGEVIAMCASRNPRGHGLTRNDVQNIWNQKLGQYRKMLEPIYKPAQKTDDIAAQQTVNAGVTPAAGPGAPPGGATPKVYKDLNDPEWLRDTAAGLKQSLKSRVAQRQSGG
jgi:hypothetical protein